MSTTETQTIAEINDATERSLTSRRTAEVAAAPKATRPARAPKAAPAASRTVKAKAPALPPKSKAGLLSARQEISRLALQAMTDAIVKANGLKKTPYLAFYTADEALQILAQMTHHFPTGDAPKGAAGKRARKWWPAKLPVPDRSDWR